MDCTEFLEGLEGEIGKDELFKIEFKNNKYESYCTLLSLLVSNQILRSLGRDIKYQIKK